MGEVEFGEQLRKARERKGITQQTLADSLYVTRQTVSRWESGNRFPDLSTTKRIAQILDTSVGELVAAEKPTIIVERFFSVENNIEKAVTTALYAASVISYMITVLSVLLRISSVVSVSREDVWIVAGQSFCIAAGLLVFVTGLINSIRGKLSPAIAGVITCVFWVTSFLSDFSKIATVSSESMASLIAVSIPNIIGVFFAYLFYFRNNTKTRWGVYAISAWGITRAFYTIVSMIVFANQYISAETAVSAVSSVCVSALFIFQTFFITEKRVDGNQQCGDMNAEMRV